MPPKAYLPEKIFTGTTWIPDHALIVQEGKIVSVIPIADVGDDWNKELLPHCFIAPSFIDIQLYGAHKKLLAAYPEPETLQATFEYCKSGGTTLFLPTLATNTKEVFYKGIDAVKAYWQGGGQGVYGLHLEGPWLHPARRGAHIEGLIHPPQISEVEEFLEYGKDVIKMITLAPEVCSPEIINLIQSHHIIISAGHSNATYEEATRSFDAGISTVTHLYNAMSPLQHRAPGLVGATLNHTQVKASIIPDGYHVDYAAVAIAKKVMGSRLFAITDAVTETNEGLYQHQLEGDKYICNGILSGSALTMHKAFTNLVHQVGIEVEEALRMCSLYPAEVLRCHHQYGKIAPGYAAQLVVLSNNLKLVDVITG